MKKLIYALLFLTAFTVAQSQQLSVTYGAKGIATLSYGGVTLMNTTAFPYDTFSIRHIQSTPTNSSTPNNTGDLTYGESAASQVWNPNTLTETYTTTWGSIATVFSQSGNNINCQITVTNNAGSGEIIDGAEVDCLTLHFPNMPNKYSGATFNSYAQFDAATANAPIYVADYGTGIATEVGLSPYATVTPTPSTPVPIYQGWNLNSNESGNSNTDTNGATVFLPIMGTTPPTGAPSFLRPQYARLQPGSSMTYTYSVRFTPEGTQANVADAAAAYTQAFPATLSWSDHRIVAAAYLATNNSGGNGIGPVGPTGCGYNSADKNNWKFGGQPLCNISTVMGVQFQDQMLTQSMSNVTNMKAQNAQGGITWDIEGEQFPQDTSYDGSPDQVATLAPEMEQAVTDTNFNGSSSAANSVANGGNGKDYTGINPKTNATWKVDEAYFDIETSAGYRVGNTLRPDVFLMYTVTNPNDTAINNYPGDGTDDATTNQAAIQVLENKANFCFNHWGSTIFYVDSMVYKDGSVMDESVMQQVTHDLPNFLFIPEALAGQWHSRQLANAAPLYNYEDNLDYGTPLDFPFNPYLVYPKGFGVNLINEGGPYSLNSTSTPIIQNAVNHGDILMNHMDYAAPQQSAIVAIENASTYSSTSGPVSPTIPALIFATIPPQVFGVAPFTINVASNSTGAITFAVVSGPATISGTTLTVTGAGAVIVSATQAANSTYSGTTVDTTFLVATPSVSAFVVTGLGALKGAAGVRF